MTSAIRTRSPATDVSLFRAIVLSAMVVGFVAGAAITVVQFFSTVPLILSAEVYEHDEPDAAAQADPAAHQHDAQENADHQHADHDHGSAAWEPKEGLQRNSLTAAANILTAIGFALLLAGIYALRGHPVAWREGLLWGLAGFAVFTVAPGLGLPPELPGVPAAPLEARQIWWIATAAATAAGLGLLVLRRAAWAVALGLGLIILPHMIGAPQPAEVHTDVPAALSQQFVVAVTLTSLVFWLLLGSLTSIAYRRFAAS
jgi:cobalt transporter subunit CbtA